MSRVTRGPQYELKNDVFTVNGRPTLMPGADIRSAESLLVTPLWAGTVSLPAGAGDTAVLGDIHHGKWRTLEIRGVVGGSLHPLGGPAMAAF